MSRQHIHIGVENVSRDYKRFVEAWYKAEAGKINKAEIHLNFEDLVMLVADLTP